MGCVLHVPIGNTRWLLIVKSGKNPSVTAIERYLHVVLFIMLHKVVLTF